MSGPIRSYQSNLLTPPDFWESTPDFGSLLDSLNEIEQNYLAELLEELTTAWRFGRDYKQPAKELAEQIQRWHDEKRF